MLGWYYFTKIMSRSTSGLTDDRWRQLKEIVVQQREELKKKDMGIERENLEEIGRYLKIPHVLIISGVRRSGKSTLLTQIMSEWYDEQFYYLNFEDERLISFSAESDFDLLYQVFLELYGEQKTFFFDEIQNVSGWERFVRRMYERDNKFVITGSNARLLSRELATHLTGRHLAKEIYPFSFREFLRLNMAEPEENFEYIAEEKAKIAKHLAQYIEDGGFPEYLRYGEKEILHRLFSDIIFRDILVRYGVRETKTFQEIANYLMANVSNTVSYNRLKNSFNLGSVNTVKNYAEYLESSFLIFFVDRFSYSGGVRHASPKKVYCADTGLRNVVSFKFSEDIGRAIENLVFIELKRRSSQTEIYYWKNRGEVDFVIKNGMKVEELIQVCYSINEETEKREVSALVDAMDEFGLAEGLIITDDIEREEEIGGRRIVFMPLWKWLLATP
ncbi:MAG: AAA family ATPase [Methanosarcinales archaeon]|nr:AAA family ATPase [Methanosarcinales archaeon]